MNKCGTCKFFTGCGDWDLCCTNPPEEETGWCGFLCYEDTPACKNYKKRGDKYEVKSSVS